MSPRLLITAILIVGLCLMTAAVSAQTDPIGKVDTVSLFLENTGKGKWMISVHIWNDEELAAIDIPIKYTAGIAKLDVDSVSYAGARIESFTHKFNPSDSAAQTVRIGGLARLTPDKPLLAAGSGEIARIYISSRDKREPGVFAADSTTLPPNGTLMLVDKNAKSIIPALKIVTVKPEKKAEKDKGKKED